MMNQTSQAVTISLIVAGIASISAVCWHSVGEIHYLKSFFPRQFSVQEAYYAASVELIKVLIICIPFGFVIIAGICFLVINRRKP
jgi:hypothetical protein